MTENETKRTEWRDLLTEPEYEAVIETVIGPLVVLVEKAGGGTLGRDYEGLWRAEVQTPDGAAYWVPITVGLPETHAGVAKAAAYHVEGLS